MTPAEASDEARRLSQLLDGALAFCKDQIRTNADAEEIYRRAKAIAWVEAPKGTAEQRRAWVVDGETAALRKTRDIAEGMVKASFEAIRSRRSQLSMLQTLMGAWREEAAYTRTGPQVDP